MTTDTKQDTSSKGTVLVTGISGFLGGHTALAFLKQGYKVRGSVRNLSKANKVKNTLANAGADLSKLEFVALDLMSDTGWEDAMHGVKYLAHTASPFLTSMPKDPEELIRPAVDGTNRAIKAALASNVERIVLTSSLVAVMYGHAKSRTALFTGKDWTNTNSKSTNAYMESKLYAEQAAWELMDKSDRRNDMTTINPGFIQGPLLDEDPGTSGAVILRALKGEFPATPKLRFPSIDVRDVAEAHVAAIQADSARGKRYLMAQSSPSLIAMTRVIGEEFPQFKSKLPKFELPDWVTQFVGMFDKDIKAATFELGYNRQIDASPVIELLGHPLIHVDDAFIAMADSLISKGLVTPPK